MDLYKAKKFMVIDKLYANSDKVWTSGWNEIGIYAIGFSGHGAGDYEDQGDDKPDVRVTALSVTPKYKLAYITALYCGSKLGGWERHTASNVIAVDGLIGIEPNPPLVIITPSGGKGRPSVIPMNDIPSFSWIPKYFQ